jgi:hypothetical protein
MILNYFIENNIRTLVASGREEMASQLGSAEVNLVIPIFGSVTRTVWICCGRSGPAPTYRSSLLVIGATTSIASWA